MALPGREPKDRRHGRTPLAEWTEVVDRPQPGRKLPTFSGVRWRAPVRDWWETVSTLPHTALWNEGDWQFAVDTALLKQQWWDQFTSKTTTPHTTLVAEIRRREDQLGTTVEARRKLRIRYVPAEPEAAAATKPGTVSRLADRRARLTGA